MPSAWREGARQLGRGAIRILSRPSPAVWLGVFVLLYFVISFELSFARFASFRVQTWDIGIFQQALWDFSHGGGFFDAADWEFQGAPSFLGIHPALLMYPLGYLYGVAPYVQTLFALQSAVVAAAAIPLFLLTAHLSGSRWKGLMAGGLFLLWAPTLAATLFDFHLEAFLPVEIFSLVWLWATRRYFWAILPAILACLTLEIGPPLLAAAGLFFLLEWYANPREAPPSAAGTSVAPTAPALRRLARWIRQPPALFGLLCILAGTTAYLLLRYLEGNVFGGGAALAAGSEALPFLIDPFQPGFKGLGIDLTLIATNFYSALIYWVVFYALLAFIPLRAVRTLVLALPWFAFTLVAQHANYLVIGNQYGFVVAVGAFVGFAYGICSIEFASLPEALRSWWSSSRVRASGVADPEATPGTPGLAARPGGYARARPSSMWSLVLLGVIVLNVAFSPINPLLDNSSLGPGYRVNYAVSPDYGPIQQVVALIPSGASVLATSDLFPYAANNPHAYTTPEGSNQGTPQLPFDGANPPTYVLASRAWYGYLPSWLDPMLWSTKDYGIRAVIEQGPHGWIFLFEHDCSVCASTPLTYRPITYDGGTYTAANGMLAGPAGFYGPDRTIVDNGTVGTAWSGPDVTLPPGSYYLNATVRVWLLDHGATEANGTVMQLYVSVLGIPKLCSGVVTVSNFTQGYADAWTDTFGFCPIEPRSLTDLTPDLQLVGSLTSTDVGVELVNFSVDPASSAP